eukprot:TRINITY_DN1407_c0_g2_i1.p1 TRINITY_DN1407_c0_g2~~TRINITY_DN1407_c0_g2_i1.p1  ORF type:complete len:287 (+),score=-24.82 TRINITY_DN1407_c0_g2_i1:124-861(+)
MARLISFVGQSDAKSPGTITHTEKFFEEGELQIASNGFAQDVNGKYYIPIGTGDRDDILIPLRLNRLIIRSARVYYHNDKVYVGNNETTYDLSTDNMKIGDKIVHGSINSYAVLEADIKYRGDSFDNIHQNHLKDFVRITDYIPNVARSDKEDRIRVMVGAPHKRVRGNGLEQSSHRASGDGLTGPIITSLEDAKAEFLKLTSAIRSGNSSSEGKERAIYLADLLLKNGILTDKQHETINKWLLK